MAHAVADLMLFGNDYERERFLKMLLEAKETFGFRLYAYCLMSNHFHLLIRTGATGISEIMQSFLTRYAWLFNKRRDRRGYVFDGRFNAPRCDTDAYRLEVVRYITMNPVRAGIITTPEDWNWSSHPELLGKRRSDLVDSDEVLSWFGDDEAQARSAYLKYLQGDSAQADARIDEALSAAKRPLLSTEEESFQSTIEAVAARICLEKSLRLEDLKGLSSDHDLSRARKEFCLQAVRSGIRPIEISRFLGRSKSLVSRFLSEGSGGLKE